jgi:hypothetical protein
MSSGTVTGKIFAAVVVLVLVVLGFFLFPGMNNMIQGMNTAGFGYILRGESTLMPYIFIGGILLTAFLLFKHAGSK